MEIDYIADVTYGAYLQQNPGKPKLGFWKRLKVRGTNSFQSERSDALIVAIQFRILCDQTRPFLIGGTGCDDPILAGE